MQVCVDGAPLIFNVPDGWEPPSSEWVWMNQGTSLDPLNPPSGYFPQAPVDWNFWSKNGPYWDMVVESVRKRLRRRMAINGAVAAGGLIISFYSYSTAEPGGAFYLFWGAVLFGTIGFFVNLLKMANVDGQAMSVIIEAATNARQLAISNTREMP